MEFMPWKADASASHLMYTESTAGCVRHCKGRPTQFPKESITQNPSSFLLLSMYPAVIAHGRAI